MNKTNNPELTVLAQNLRKTMTPEERHLWYDFLKKLPYTIQRQKVLSHYIVDFYCAAAKLIIELDGAQHYEPAAREKDLERDQHFRNLGFTVLRYTNLELHQNFDGICQDILLHMKSP